MNENKYQQQLVSSALSELLINQNFKKYVVSKINESLKVYGFDALPAILYILTRGIRSDYKVDSVRITPDFIENIIEGYIRDVVSYCYTHRALIQNKEGEPDKKICIYYEDNIVRITNYHTPMNSVLTDSDVIKTESDYSIYNEYHPAMINMSTLLSIN